MHVGNKVYLSNKYAVKKDFKKYLDQYKTSVEAIDFKASSVLHTINHWVKKQTENKMKQFLDKGFDEEYKMLLISAVYFKGHFLKSFQKENITKRNFYTSPKEVIQAEFMEKTGLYNYCESSHLKSKIVEVALDGKDVYIVLVLPDDRNGLIALENQIDEILSTTTFHEERVSVYAPRFKLECKLNNLRKTFQEMGMKRPFTTDADFEEFVVDSQFIYINDIIQRTCIEIVDEDIETNLKVASSARKVQAPTKTFVADHPFIFYIKVKDIVIIIGRVVCPQ